MSEPEDVGGVYYIVTYSNLLVLTREGHSTLKGPVTCTWQLIRIHIYKLHVNISTYLDLGGGGTSIFGGSRYPQWLSNFNCENAFRVLCL